MASQISDSISEHKFLQLKKRLDSLHYCHPLTLDSAALAERLLTDLLKTTEGFQTLKKSNQDLQTQLLSKDKLNEPLIKENNRLLQENNELHYEMIKIKEEADYKENRWKTMLKTAEGDKQDIKFLLKGKETSMQKLIEENSALKKKIDVVLTKCYVPSSVKGLGNKEWEKENLKSSSNIAKGIGANELEELYEKKSEDWEKLSQTLRENDERFFDLKNKLKISDDRKIQLEEKIKHYELQINNRDKEIARLHKKIQTNPINIEKISSEFTENELLEKNSRLEKQLDFLSRENLSMNEKISEMKKDYARSEFLRNENDEKTNKIQNLIQEKSFLERKLQNFEEKINSLEIGKQKEGDYFQEEMQEKDEKMKDFELKISELSHLLSEKDNEIRILIEKQQISNDLASAYHSDKKAFLSQLSSQEKLIIELESELKLRSETIDKITIENNKFQDNITNIKSQMLILQRENDFSKEALIRNRDENKELIEKFNEQRSTLTNCETKIVELNNIISELQLNIERSERGRLHTEKQLNDLRNESFKYKNDVDSTQQEKLRLKALNSSSQQDIEFLKRDISNLEELLSSTKKALVLSETKQSELISNIYQIQEQNKLLTHQLEIQQNDKDNLKQELRIIEQKRTDLERNLLDSKNLEHKIQNLENRNKKLNDDNTKTEKEIFNLSRKLDEKTLDLAEKQAQLTMKEKLLVSELKEKESLISELSLRNEEISRLSQHLSKYQTHNAELSVQSVHIDKLSENQRLQIIQLEQQKLEISQLRTTINNETRRNEDLKREKALLDAENTELKSLYRQSKNENEEFKTKIFQFEEENRNINLIINDLKGNNNRENEKFRLAQQKLIVFQREKANLQTELTESLEKNHQLNILIDSLSKNKEELLIRLSEKINEKNTKPDEISNLKSENSLLKKELSNLRQELQNNERNLLRIDQERDEMQGLLDEKTEENHRLSRSIRAGESQLSELQRQIAETQGSKLQNIQKLSLIDNSLRETQREKDNLLNKLDRQNFLIAEKDAQIDEMTGDLQMLTREHQRINDELIFKAESIEKLEELLRCSSENENELRMGLKALEFEKEDILKNYRVLCEENQRLEKIIEEINEDNENKLCDNSELVRRNRELAGALAQRDAKEAEKNQEISGLERQNSLLSRKLEQNEKIIREFDRVKQSSMKDIESMRKFNDSLENSKGEFQRNFVMLEEEKKGLELELRDCQNENRHKEMLLEQLVNEKEKLEEILIQERQCQLELKNELLRLEAERGEIKAESHFNLKKEKNSKINENNMLSELKKTIDKLTENIENKAQEIDFLMREQKTLREENSRLRMSVYRSESERKNQILESESLREKSSRFELGSFRKEYLDKK